MILNPFRPAAVFCCLIVIAATAWGQATAPLFTIARSKNANTVCYEARLATNGAFDKPPIHVYWTMWAKDTTGASREELTGIEKRLAFGFTLAKYSPTRCEIRLAAFRDRLIEIGFHGKSVRAVTTISGKPSYIKKIYVKSGDGMVIPKVTSATIYGTDTANGAPVQETIKP
jgi:hypothetical protein